MRTGVDDQILEFKSSNKRICEKCDSADKLHVDHIKQFEELKLNFMSNIELKKPNQFNKLCDGTNRICFLSSDNEFENEWYSYNLKNASLRYLCQRCNLTRPRYKKL